MALCTAYGMLGMEAESIAHFHKALELAQRYEAYYNIATNYYYIQKSLNAAFAGFTEELKVKVIKISEDVHGRYVRFMDSLSLNSIYRLLNSKDYIFLYYAVQGLTNKEIADRLHISVGTVGKRFGEIYAALGVANRAAMVELYKRSVSGTLLEK